MSPAAAPTLGVRIANFVLFQLAWFAIVLGTARGYALWGTLCAVAVIGWHLAISARPDRESALLACLLAIGFVFETLMVGLGHVRYPNGQPLAWLAPYWMVALWGLFAVTLNVTFRWLRGRRVLAALLGAIAGPLSFAAGVRLGAAKFVDPDIALALLALGWALLMPLLMTLAERLDGVAAPIEPDAPGGLHA